MMNRLVLLALPVVLISALSGCERSGNSTASAGQVVARVDGEEISVHQINALLRQLPSAGGDPKILSLEVLNRLIDQQLLVKQALEQKLDRNPQVMLQLEAARREVLARAYTEQLGDADSPADPATVREFYREHPDLFAKRRIYTLNELVVRPSPVQMEAVKAKIEAASDIAALSTWLKAQNVAFTSSGGRKPAEQLPLELLPRFASLKDGEIAFFTTGTAISVIHLQSSEEAPIAEADATAAIQQYIAARKRSEAVRSALKQLHASADIQYLGDFAKAAATMPAP